MKDTKSKIDGALKAGIARGRGPMLVEATAADVRHRRHSGQQRRPRSARERSRLYRVLQLVGPTPGAPDKPELLG